ncbi:protein MRVI1 isoform X2 [Rhinatrema bivittatum]|uniref:protein MRVI1 isoform X2 n=1 Tax=Rhinatrema bivittatum TaxID=194408 RepID=UPI001127E7B7|nr:protein MRVI1 isoform X2 [Rhinatrema bivittatum]
MPTQPEDENQPAQAQDTISSPLIDSTSEVRANNTPCIVLPETAVSPEAESDKNLVNRAHGPGTRHLIRHIRNSFSSENSLTSVDNLGHVIDLLHDRLPEVRISDEDKKRNLELLEEARKVSEQFLTRRGRRSRCSLSDSPTGSDVPAASVAGSATQAQNATKGLTDRRQNDQRKVSQGRLVPRSPTFLNPKETLSEQKENFDPQKHMDNSQKLSTANNDSCKMTLNNSKQTKETEFVTSFLNKSRECDTPSGSHLQKAGAGARGPLFKESAPVHNEPRVAWTAESHSPVTRPPLLRALSWDSLDPVHKERIASESPAKEEACFVSTVNSSNALQKITGHKEFHIQPVRLQKLTKLREEHILMRNQILGGPKLPDLSEAAEQERGPSPVTPASTEEEEANGSSAVMPNIPDLLLRRLHVHKPLSGSAAPLSEKEVENVFVQLSLAFRNDSYTLESRLHQAERERNLTEENNEKELDNFKAAITSSALLWQPSEHREAYQKLLEDITVLHRLTTRLSGRAEMVGAVRQEKRMSKATEVMMQYVENLKRTYEKDHAELTEFKKLANQNSSRTYSGSEDGVSRSSRSMSLTMGKNMPRRRVSVAVVPKFNLLNIPGQSSNTSSLPMLSSLSETPIGRNVSPVPTLTPSPETGKTNGDPENEALRSVQGCQEEINPEFKARIEEEAYNKGYQEGMKKSKELQELKEDYEQKMAESLNEAAAAEKEEEIQEMKSSKIEELVDYLHLLFPKLLKHWNVLGIVIALIILLAAVYSMYSSYHSCTELSDGPHGRASRSANQKYSWWNSRLQQKHRTD